MDFKKIADKWQKAWEDAGIFKVKEGKKKFYCLEMYPYPSASLHIGHLRNYSLGDALTRYKRMQGFSVLYPMGYDAFGLPAENAAIKHGAEPEKWTRENMASIKKQQKAIGLSYDWDREIASCNEDYYKWNQWIFLKFLEKGLAYKKKSAVNWCPGCHTVLANEQVEQGKCWRCKSIATIKDLDQWFFKITDYAEELLKDIEKLEWPERVKIMQENWIGKSEGTFVDFKLKDTGENLRIFTTRPDTLYGVTFMVYAPEHPKVMELVKGTKYEKDVEKFIKKVVIEEKFTRAADDMEKEGMFIGKYAINPLNGDEIPIYIANFVLLDYGTGLIMAVPAHDQRDFEFAKKYKIPVKVVIQPNSYKLNPEKMSRAYIEDGSLTDSGEFDGSNNRDAIPDIIKYLEKKKIGKKTINYKLRDWLISRQRYWGTPIPIIYCEKCGRVPVPLKDLPVKLPKDVKFTGKGNPLETSKSFTDVKCPSCNGKAKRETDTMDTFVDSSWYFLRYCSPKFDKLPFEKKKADYWMPVDQYIGGIEHAVLHLLYARFFTKGLRDLGLVNIDEPFKKLLCQGMVIKDGEKMSKSVGNVIDPNEISDKYGPDTARLFILFASLPEKELDWSDKGVAGAFRFLKKVCALVEEKATKKGEMNSKDKYVLSKTHSTIKKVTDQMEKMRYSHAIGTIMEFVNVLGKYNDKNPAVFKEAIENLILLISPFTPHIAEELWEKIGNKRFISTHSWPEYDKKKIDEKVEAGEELVAKTKKDISAVIELIKIKPKEITIIVSSDWKYAFFNNMRKTIEKTRDVKEVMKAVMIKEHAKDIAKMVPALVKDTEKIPDVSLNQKTELTVLNESIKEIEETFEAKITIVKAEDSKEGKAKQAMPGKPAIIIK
ncbi:MAG: leucine--tRNA ligase [bacterium]|nr:leucine--tRNA ligase [bacterium]